MEGYAAVNRDFDRSEDDSDQKLLSADPSYNIHRATRCITRRAIFCEFIALLIAFSSGYLVNLKIDPRTAQNQGPISLSSSRQLFTYNRIFSNPPSVITNQAWTDLFPARGGFFTHPTLAPDLSVVAVFHQLHCIDAIRHGYYTAAEVTDPATSNTAALHHGDAPHVRHCLDYLRQAIMCHADTNIEPVIPELGGAKGFGVEHSCRRYDELVDWVKQWE